MIISRAPVRLTLAGGTTDLKSYYSKNEGFLVASGINKYTYVIANRGYYDHIHLKYSDEERVNNYREIKHPIFKWCLSWFEITEPIELVSMSDVPAGCGLGTSGSFTVALCRALEDYKHKDKHFHLALNKRDMAEIACHIEIDILEEPIGKQDQYACAFGGLNGYTFHKDGTVEVESLHLTEMMMHKLKEKLLLFDTQIKRKASDILGTLEMNEKTVNRLDKIKEMAYETKRLLQHSQYDDYGVLLDDYWKQRRKLSDKVSNSLLDEYYEIAIKNGALGGKLQGAGGGGFFMFYCPLYPERLIQAMLKLGLKYMDWDWDIEGVKGVQV